MSMQIFTGNPPYLLLQPFLEILSELFVERFPSSRALMDNVNTISRPCRLINAPGKWALLYVPIYKNSKLYQKSVCKWSHGGYMNRKEEGKKQGSSATKPDFAVTAKRWNQTVTILQLTSHASRVKSGICKSLWLFALQCLFLLASFVVERMHSLCVRERERGEHTHFMQCISLWYFSDRQLVVQEPGK